MRTSSAVTRAGAVKALTAALCREKRSVNQIRIRAVLSVALVLDGIGWHASQALLVPGNWSWSGSI